MCCSLEKVLTIAPKEKEEGRMTHVIYHWHKVCVIAHDSVSPVYKSSGGSCLIDINVNVRSPALGTQFCIENMVNILKFKTGFQWN